MVCVAYAVWCVAPNCAEGYSSHLTEIVVGSGRRSSSASYCEAVLFVDGRRLRSTGGAEALDERCGPGPKPPDEAAPFNNKPKGTPP